jgi:hypothetical protein
VFNMWSEKAAQAGIHVKPGGAEDRSPTVRHQSVKTLQPGCASSVHAGHPDRLWIWTEPGGVSRLVGTTLCKHRFERPRLPGSELLAAYQAKENSAIKHLEQICGQLRLSKVRCVACTVECEECVSTMPVWLQSPPCVCGSSASPSAGLGTLVSWAGHASHGFVFVNVCAGTACCVLMKHSGSWSTTRLPTCCASPT